MPKRPEPGAVAWVDPDDAPELTEEWFDDAVWEVNGARIQTPDRRAALSRMVEMKLDIDADVAAFFRTSEPGWQQRINAALRGIIRQS